MNNLKYEFDNLNSIKKVECVAFDIFDTIIVRDVFPEYVKILWAKELANILGIIEYKDKIYEYRNKIELDLCNNNYKKGFDQEFKYDDMTDYLYDYIKDNIKISKEEFKKISSRLEIETEIRVQNVDEKWLEFIKYLKEKNIRIICISDFYMSSVYITEIFKKHKILRYIDKLYISSDFLITKRSGKLYDYVLKNENIYPDKILMIGDNKYSDYEMPLSKGINSYNINRIQQNKIYDEHKATINNITNKIDYLLKDKSSNSHFLDITYSLYSFIDLLYSRLLKDNVRNIFFLSREGEFLKKLFDLYRERQNYKGDQYINSHYIIVSRKSTFLPSLKDLENENFENLFRQYRKISLYDFLSSLNFSIDDIKLIADSLKVDMHTKEEDFPTSTTFSNMVASTIFLDIYNAKRLEQNTNFKTYISQYGVNIETEGFNIVDVGWKGTIQDNIFNIYDGKIKINGYYVGLILRTNIVDGNNKYGLLFNNIDKKSKYYDIFNENRALFEIILGASHGSANGYVKSENGIIPITHQEEDEIKLYNNVIKILQNDIFIKFKEILSLFSKTTISYEDYSYKFAKKHAKMVFFPKKSEIKFFREMYHFENFGVFEFTDFRINKLTFTQRLNNLKILLTNPREIMNRGFWGVITLEDQGLGIFKTLYGYYKKYKTLEEK